MTKTTICAALWLATTLPFAALALPDSVTATATKYVCPPCGDGACDKQEHAAPGTCPTCGMTLVKKAAIKNYDVAIVVYDGVELLDFAGPGEAFKAASMHGASAGFTFNVYTVAPTIKSLVSEGFLTIKPEYSIDNAPKPDVVVFPGGNVGTVLNDPKFMSWAKSVAADAEVAMSVCNGAFVLATNGQLDGLDVTTHWGSIAALRAAVPTATVHENRRFMDNGRFVTTAGVSAGIDGSLHVIARLAGFDVAKSVARYMEYLWKPDARTTALAIAATPEELERDKAFEETYKYVQNQDWAPAAEAFNKLANRFPDDAEIWYYVGLTHHNAKEWDRAIEAHKRSASLPGYIRHRPLYNLACSYALMGKSEAALDTLESAIEAGWNDRTYTRADADLVSLRELPRFNELLKLLKGGDTQ